MSVRARTSLLGLCLVTAAAGIFHSAAAQEWVAPRTPDGHPDLQGNWSNATLTPFERRAGQPAVMTRDEIDRLEGRAGAVVTGGAVPSDPTRGPPPITGAIGRSYNEIYYDRGDRLAVVNGETRSSLVTFPADGRIPELTPEGQRRKHEYEKFRSQFNQYDHPELRPLAERCIVFYGSSSASVMGPPMTPTRGYNNNFTIVQNADYVLIRSEMIHDTRIIRLGHPERLPKHVRPWFGDSWGHFEGNTLVVETTNIHPDMGFNEQGDKILNSEDLKVMRPSLLPGLLSATKRNVDRSATSVRLFELGRRYFKQGERATVGFVLAGEKVARGWQTGKAQPFDAFDAKAEVIALLAAAGAPVGNLQSFGEASAAYHPGQSGTLRLGPKAVLAEYGVLHPNLARQFGLTGAVVAGEIFLDAIPAKRKSGALRAPYAPPPLQAVKRDFAFLVPDAVEADALVRAVRGADKKAIVDARLFDVFVGPGVEDGHKSLAIEVTLQPGEKSFSQEELEAISAAVVKAAAKLGATLRG